MCGVKGAVRAGDKAPHWPPVFLVSDYRSLTNYLTIIGIFHSSVGYCLQELASRAATQVRTRALLSGTSFTELLNALPGSPKWKRYFKSNLARKLLVIGILFPTVSTIGGILYKQALVLTTFETHSEERYNYTFVTNCTYAISDCLGNMYLKYGVALSEARFGGAYSKGIETIESGRRLTFVAAPTAAQITTPKSNITSLNGLSLAIVADYQNVTSGETLPTSNGNITASDRSTTVSLAFYGKQNLDWSVAAKRFSDAEPYQTVRGMTRYCVVQSEWRTIKGSLSLQKYTLDDAKCTQLDLGFWSNSATPRAQNYGKVMGLSLTTDIIDEFWNPHATHQDVLQSAYVVPTMYAVLVLGGWGGYWGKLRNSSVTNWTILSPVLNVTQTNKVLAIKTEPAFMIPYLIILLLIFIAHWVSGLFSQKAYVTEWAPLWFGLLSDHEQENVRDQIRSRNIFESEGLKEIDGDSEGQDRRLLMKLEPESTLELSDFTTQANRSQS